MRTVILNGVILTPNQKFSDHVILIDGDRIYGIAGRAEIASLDDFKVIDANGCYVIPGLIDIHIHGSNGADTMDGTPEAIETIAIHLACHGTTSFLPTTVTASSEDTLQAIDNVRGLSPIVKGARPLGIHLEGPYLSHNYRGAQPEQHLRFADPKEYMCWINDTVVRLITVAPEIPGVMDLIRQGAEYGVNFAIGHSEATYEQVIEAVENGANQITHLFNGMPPLHHRMPGIVGAALSDARLFVQIIPDGIHVHPVVIKILLAAKGSDHVIAISDAIRAAGLSDGEYSLGDQIVQVRDGIARTKTGGLAGSLLTLDQGLRNMMEFTDLPLQEILPMFTSVPASAIGIEQQKGTLKAGADADIVLLDEHFNVFTTIIAGQVVYERRQENSS